MSRPIFLDLRQLRGQWIAQVTSASSERLLGVKSVAVVRDWENGMLDWQTRTYVETALDGWWDKPSHSSWSSHLFDGAIIWVRHAVSDGTEGGSIGRSKGVWRISNVEKSDTAIRFQLTERIGEKRS